MRITNSHKNLHLDYKQKLITRIENLALKHYPNEFGGILVGYYSFDLQTLILTDILTPDVYKSYKTLFERGANGIKKKLVSLFKQKEKHYYVGEWHSHPDASSMYSRTDLKAMKSIAESESVRILNPILLIVSINDKKMIDYTFYLFSNYKLLKYGK